MGGTVKKRQLVNISDVSFVVGALGTALGLLALVPLSDSLRIYIMIGLTLTGVVALIFISVFRLKKFYLNECVFHENCSIGGEFVAELISGAKRYVRVTHFTEGVPSVKYSAAMEHLLNSSVSIQRVICFANDDFDRYVWVEEAMQRECSRLHQRYLPRDFMVLPRYAGDRRGNRDNRVAQKRSHHEGRFSTQPGHQRRKGRVLQCDIHDLLALVQ
jgi:hypothetical protein